MHTQVSFKQFNPNKHGKYGIPQKSINVGNYHYTFVSSLYYGKSRKDGQYYIEGINAVDQNLVDSLTLYVGLKVLSFHRYYTSMPLAEWLLKVDNVKRKGISADI